MKITKNYELGNGVMLKAVIDDGIAIIISTCATEWRKIYFQCKKDGKNVIWDYRTLHGKTSWVGARQFRA
jgi:hypothetical protein